MKLSEPHLEIRSGVFYARIIVPADVRAALGRSKFSVSLGTSNLREAIAERDRIVPRWQAAIRSARATRATPAANATSRPGPRPGRVEFKSRPEHEVTIPADIAIAAIEAWRDAEIASLRDRYFNGLIPAGYSLLRDVRPDAADIRIAAILSHCGFPITPDHGAVATSRSIFASAWQAIKDAEAQYAAGRFVQGVEPIEAKPEEPAALLISELLERFCRTQRIEAKDESEMRTYVRRLIEFRGDLQITAYTNILIDDFLVDVRDFPRIRRPDIAKKTFSEIVSWRRGLDDNHPDTPPRLADKTVWKWSLALNRLFKYAEAKRLIPYNPVRGSMPSKGMTQKKIVSYDDKDIGQIFGSTLFTGSDGKGYRLTSGSIIVKDERYWLPIISLFSGMRLEEIAALKTEEIKTIDDVSFFDLRDRPLFGARRVKNKNAQRIVPVHPELKRLGFLTYISERRADKDSPYVFHRLDHERPNRTPGVLYGKWFGNWISKLGETIEGQTFDIVEKNFHSFRHTWKRAMRETSVKEEIHDLISGHGKADGVGRGYGEGAALRVLADAMAELSYPTFPL